MIAFVTLWLAAAGLMAAEYHGTVKAGGLPLPGATVTVGQNGKTVAATTDERGEFRFANLPADVWTFEVEMVGFETLKREVTIGPGAPAPSWEMRFLPVQAPAGRQPATASAPERTFQRLSVNQASQNGTAANGDGAIKSEELPDLTQSAANSFIVQGSMSSALGLGPENDWGPRFGMEPGMPGMMGPAGMLPGGPGTDGPAMGQGMPSGGARAGPGGDFGRPGFGGPGGPGMGPGGGMGPGMGGPPRQGRGWGGRPPAGGPDWRARRGAMAFGNRRRNPANSYMFGGHFSLNNSALDARTFSVTGAELNKPAYANARGGFMFGGPLRIPKLVSAERRILFSFNYEMQRNRTGTVSNPVNMPTTLERAGDFSQSSIAGAPFTIYDPATGAPFPGNVIPQSRISSTASTLLKYFPDPNLPYAVRNYQISLNGLNNSQNLNARLSNIRIGTRDRLNFGIGYQGSDSVTTNLFQFIDTGAGSGINVRMGWSRTIAPTVTNNAYITFSRMRQEALPYFSNREDVAALADIAGTSEQARNWGPPNLSFTNYGGLTDGNYSLNRNQTVSVGNSLIWVRGAHNMTFGGGYRRQQINQLADANGRGTYGFTGLATSLLVNGVAQSGTGYDLADFLLGVPATSSIRYGNPDKYFRGAGYDVFLNDDWRVNSRFTLVAGLRWEYAAPMTELYNRLVNLSIAPAFAGIVAVKPGETSLPDALIHPDRNNFSPRVGFAWRPKGDRSLVVRGGYGIYCNTSVYGIVAGNMAQQPPFAQSLSVTSSAGNLLNIQNAFLLASALSNTNTYAVDPNYRIGYAQTWSLSVQHDLPFSMFGTVGYLGTKGTRLDQQFIPNSVPPGAAESALPHSFIYETSNGNSIYHAAQFQLNRRFHSGVMWRASYQLSKSIDNAGAGGRGQANTPVAQNWLDLSAERALSSFDARHNLGLQLQYSTGMGVAGGTLMNGPKGALLKDWTFSAGVTVRSGNPLTATVGGNRSQVGGTAVTNTVRADATGLPVSAEGQLFNTAAFAQPTAGLWGNAGRNTIPGPAIFSLDGSVGRVFRLGERRSIDLQLQSQNLLNHVTITGWGTLLGSNTYGLATNAAPMRRMTALLRFRF